MRSNSTFRLALPLALAALAASCGGDDGPPDDDQTSQADASPDEGGEAAPPVIHMRMGGLWSDFDQYWCRGSMVPEQHPVFTEIRRDRFEIDPVTDQVTLPAAWLKEAREVRGPELEEAAKSRVPRLLATVAVVTGRPFTTRDFNYFFYLCPHFDGGTASAKVFPMFMYLESAVGSTLQWPDWLFTDQYVIHEVLHDYAIEKIDYRKGTPTLNRLYAELVADDEFTARAQRYLGYPEPITPEYEARWAAVDQTEMIANVLTHVHVYAVMTAVFDKLGERERLDTIRSYETENPAPHPSYVQAWRFVQSIEDDEEAMATVLAEVGP